ncbi:Small-conductance mechanosensitive channel [Halorhabdus sp. SVX81]|uniref:mechanosensitive ion channel family protein n=1 Tax=Halorhabdus sp. SVX81 TaxID=2978283 RepID=UPI0023DBFD73|nr:mechanosensitive ion channel family protein [Halorhabdus sp. SVX81]WEL17573.1 Small-conductance mechanosensitive channel [Halorhabdus sp. SVX81]
MASLVSLVSEFQQFLESLASTQARIAATVAVGMLAIIVAAFILPVGLDRAYRLMSTRLGTSRLADWIRLVGEYVPRTVAEAFVRLVQGLVLAAAGLALLVIWGLVDTAELVLRYLGGSLPVLGRGSLTLVVALLAYVGADQYKQMVVRIGKEATWLTDHQQEIVIRLGQIGILLTAGLVVLTVWEVNLQGLLVGAGFLGIVVGLAARQTLGALIAGFVLMFSRPFEIGDWIEIGEEEGVVTDITIMNTRLENFDGEVVYLPNDRVNEQAIVNRSRRGSLRLRVDVGIDYDSDPEHAKAVALETIKEIDVVADGPPPQIVPKSFGDSAVILEMRFWIDHPTPPRKWNAVERVVTAVKTAFEREGIKIPFPQRELSGRAETNGFQVQESASGSEDVR